MRRPSLVLLVALGTLILLPAASCTRLAVPIRSPSREISLAIDRTVAYLQAQYNPTIGLLRESPETAPDTYWLFTDNRLAAYALAEHGEQAFAAALEKSISSYLTPARPARHGLIEVLGGASVDWPPRTHRAETLVAERLSQPFQVRVETRDDDGAEMLDWEQYADLAFIGALDARHRGDAALAAQRFEAGIDKWDGVGFADVAFQTPGSNKLYATYKLALAVRTSAELDKPLDPAVLQRLLGMQLGSGGFVALYDVNGSPVGDSNTETSAYALLALLALAKG